jgi:hypothetical protein
MPLINVSPAVIIHQKRLISLELPFSIQIARIVCLAFALLCWLSIPFIHIRSIDADRLRHKGLDPELVNLMLNFSMLCSPVLIVLILSFIGLPIIDVYIYSYSIFTIMAGWLWWKRKTFWPINDVASMSDKHSRINNNTTSYTTVLTVLCILALAFFSFKIAFIVNPPEGYSAPLSATIPEALTYVLLVAGCLLTIILRLRNSQNATDVTAVLSIILIFWIPFGTAAYIYWRMKIKAIELAESSREVG